MDEEPTLPPLPAIAWDRQSQTFGNSRKRGRPEKAPPLFSHSSDPAVFSSDDDPTLENYVHGRRKKRYVGAWFAQLPTSSDSMFDDDTSLAPASPRPKRTLERHLDSGVWVGGDDTDMDLDGDELPPLPHRGALAVPERRQRRAFQRVPSLRVGSAELAARTAIQKCIDDGLEDIDLSNWDLRDLTNATMEPLAGFSCIPLVAPEVEFEQRAPSLRLNLSQNQLTRLPGAIFEIEHLTMLSVMRNELAEIPPAIGKLKNLRQLNVSTNHLHYLPYELLELLRGDTKMTDVYLHPNPFYTPRTAGLDRMRQRLSENEAVRGEIAPSPDRNVGITRGGCKLMARTPVQYLDSCGETYSRFRLPSTPSPHGPILVEVEDLEDVSSPPSSDPRLSQSHPASRIEAPSRVPTLIELALRACYDSPELASVPALLPPKAPAYMTRHLEAALAQKETGGWNCSVCRRPIVVPRAVWLEWWDLDRRRVPGWSVGCLIPFLRRGCSWLCVPSTAGEGVA